jgi:hypothetical protein
LYRFSAQIFPSLSIITFVLKRKTQSLIPKQSWSWFRSPLWTIFFL